MLLWIVPPSESCQDYLLAERKWNEILLELVQISTLPALEACVIDLTGVFGIVLKKGHEPNLELPVDSSTALKVIPFDWSIRYFIEPYLLPKMI